MIPAFMALIGLIFGDGSLDAFYIDKIEQGVNKCVDDKDRKKDLKAELKQYTKAFEEFNKKRDKSLKELKKKNEDRNTSSQWYEAYFADRLEERKELQSLFMDQRIQLQENITDDEWIKIMSMASDATTKADEKEQKKEAKKKHNDFFAKLENSINKNIDSIEKRNEVFLALKHYEEVYNQVGEAYDIINLNQNDKLADKHVTKSEMEAVSMELNMLRIDMYAGYTDFIMIARENTTDEEWKALIKQFNKDII